MNDADKDAARALVDAMPRCIEHPERHATHYALHYSLSCCEECSRVDVAAYGDKWADADTEAGHAPALRRLLERMAKW